MNANVDPAEIAKFEALADRWWDDTGEFKPLHDINPLRADYIDERSSVAGKAVIDIGCGGGILCEAMAQRGANVTGIDMGGDPLEVARKHAAAGGLNIHYRQITAEEIAAEQPAQYDVVSCLEMLEHVPEPESVIKACFDLCKPGGQVFFSTINRNPKSFLFAVVGAEYILNMLPRGTHDYARFIKPSELGRWARAAGLKVEGLTGMSHNPLTKNYWLGRDVDVNYLMHCSKPA